MKQLNGVVRIVLTLMIGSSAIVGTVGCMSDTSESARPKGVDYYVQGMQFYRAGQRDEAIKLLEKAVAANPSLRMAQTTLGDAYRAKGDYARAATHYEAATRLDPYTGANQYNLGVTYQFLNRLQDAAAAYLRAIQLNPRDVKSNMNLGLVYLALGQIDDAIRYLDRATALDPKNAAAWSNLGVALDARGYTSQAESTYRKALELDSNNLNTQQNLAQNLISQGKAGEAINLMNQVLAKSDTPGVHKRYGDALVIAKRYDDAIKQYDAALFADPNYAPAMTDKAFAMIQKYVEGLELDDTQRNQALDLWRRSLKINPNQPKVSAAISKWEKPGLFGG